MVAPGGKSLPFPVQGRSASGVRAASRRGKWGDWVLFGAAYAVIMGAILFAYPPASAPRHEASVSTSTSVR
ncbi:hypothetical protein GCM10007301_01560 [Azorhizobium oxalatiphilum]|uniref:Uncharacterized protein n=1 Tax=Azorhizobium oxalatiphilum TaxID=980631 RepID=A0A917BLN6_9HYPH|nr:hypothetical protein [Azorhizobium oxalatiphilum]GGF45738.1 hypothetical protein GCM10007301_01560 [Azorhizobium oxalatiphilum]